MPGTRLVGVAVLAAAPMLALALSAPAFAQRQAVQESQSSPAASSAAQAVTPLNQIKPVTLNPIKVLGHKVYIPEAFHMIKAALTRPVSFANKDMDKLVCRRTHQIGSRLVSLDCATNCRRWVTQQATQIMLATGTDGGFSTQMCDGPNGSASPSPSENYREAETVAAAVAHADARGSASALLGLVWKLASVGPNYTLRVTDHGKVDVEYVVKGGKVVKVRRVKPGKNN